MNEMNDIVAENPDALVKMEKPRAPKLGVQTLPINFAALQKFDTVIDTRSPAEFAEDHLPGAINCPVLDNEQRIQVGTLYKQTSAFDAKKLGAGIVARNIANHIDTLFADKPKSWKPLIYCWRGGTRSGAMTHILRTIGWNALQLEGGYKAWRGQVRSDLETLPVKFSYRVICGRTGSGKSRLLDALALQGAQVLDLEKLAAHKGSVLGDLPDEAQPSQKMFDSRIWLDLSRFDPELPVYVEAESRKVGLLRVPEVLIATMHEGTCFEVVTPAPLRAKLLREEYAHLIANPDLLFFKLDCIKALHSTERITEWKTLAREGKWDDFVASMLEHHYDPAYSRSMFSNYQGANAAAPLEVSDISPAGFTEVARQLLVQSAA
jgi:tRNA 2-selenouridine synthase